MNSIILASTLLTSINVLLILSLLYVYINNLKQAKSVYTVGLVLFAVLFLLHNSVCLYSLLTMTPHYVDGMEWYQLTFAGLQTIAFSIMTWITWR
jgi:hypothetical protein